MLHSMDEWKALCSVVTMMIQTWTDICLYQSIQEKVAGSQLFMQLRAERPMIHHAVMCLWHGETYARCMDSQVFKKEVKMRIARS